MSLSLNVYSTTEMWLDEFLCLNVCPGQISFSRQTGSRKKKDQCTLNLETGKQTRRCSVPFQQRWECKKQTARLLSNFICIFSTLSYKNQSQRPNISQIRTFSRNSIGLKFRPIAFILAFWCTGFKLGLVLEIWKCDCVAVWALDLKILGCQ